MAATPAALHSRHQACRLAFGACVLAWLTGVGRAAPIDIFAPSGNAELAKRSEEAWQAYAARDWARARTLNGGLVADFADDSIAALLKGRGVRAQRAPRCDLAPKAMSS
jgi:hypothetical protein